MTETTGKKSRAADEGRHVQAAVDQLDKSEIVAVETANASGTA